MFLEVGDVGDEGPEIDNALVDEADGGAEGLAKLGGRYGIEDGVTAEVPF